MGIRMDSLPPRYQKQAARKLDPVAYEKALQFFHAEELSLIHISEPTRRS